MTLTEIQTLLVNTISTGILIGAVFGLLIAFFRT